MHDHAATLRARLGEIYAPAPLESVSAWCERHLVNAGEVGRPGPVSFRDFAYMVPYLDTFSDGKLTDKAVMAGAQTSKSSATQYGLAWTMEHNPRDVLWVTTSKEMAQSYSEMRWQPMVENSPVMAAMKPADGDKYKHLEQAFLNSIINFAGSESLGGVAQRTKQIVVQDEYDKHRNPKVSEEADRRTTSAVNPMRIKISAPLYDGGPMHRAWKSGDRREWELRCAHCDGFFVPDFFEGKIGEHFDALTWSQEAKTPDGGWDLAVVEKTAGVKCPHCHRLNVEATRLASIRAGREVAHGAATALPGHASWRWPLWLAPWASASWGSIARQMLEAKAAWNMQHFDNNVRSVPSKTAGEGVQIDLLKKRKYEFVAWPAKAWILTVGVDSQDDRLEVHFLSFGDGFETWSVEYQVIHGDTSTPQPYAELYTLLFETPRPLQVSVVCFDSGGHNTDMVYRFCKQHAARKVFAVRGRPHPGRPVASRPSRKNKYGVKLYSLGVDTAKFQIHGQFKVEADGPGKVHLRADYDDEFFKQLAAEEVQTSRRKGAEVKTWVQVYQRNEALDTWVYAYAGLMILGGDRAIAYAKKKVLAARAVAAEAGPAPYGPPAATAPAKAVAVSPGGSTSGAEEKPKVLARAPRVRVGGWSATNF